MKHALITGASGAIGSAIGRRLAADGLHVILHANHNPGRAEALAAEIRADGGSAGVVVFDVTDHEACATILDPMAAEHPIQVLVNNAGIHDDAPFPGMDAKQWSTVIDVSLNGFFNVTRPLAMPMLRTRWGRIISLSSVAGVIGNRGQVNYSAAKAGLHGASKSLALELAPRGVTVNVVAPGIIAGGMADAAFEADAVKRLVPMRRAGTGTEVAALIAFLASDQAGYLSGQVIGIDGAMT